jgi:hypothetical protein
MAAFDAFWHMDMRNLSSINDALLTLIPKSVEAKCIKDYRPILHIHCLGKLFSKVLVTRLASRLPSLVHGSQSAFIKGRFIQDNFRYVESSTKLLHNHKRPCLLLKVDISRSFDSVTWPFYLELIHHMGCPTI